VSEEEKPRRETNQERLREAFWPEITDAASARRAALYGVWAAAITILVTVFRVVFGSYALPADFGVQGLVIESLAFAACGAGIWLTGSRVAACGGLILFLAQKYLQFAGGVTPNFGTVLIWLGIAVLWLTAIRGTFRLHALQRDDA
jgi:hypothetical protein